MVDKSQISYIPNTTYRVQLNKDFTFQNLIKILPYLKELGIDTIYTSPFFKAIPGSMHGYNIIDSNCINPEIGTEKDFQEYLIALKKNNLEQIIDIVPNHMGVLGAENKWWLDILENGPASIYTNYFDIDWNPFNPNIRNKILLPILGEHYGRVIDNKEIQLSLTETGFHASYYSNKLPLAPDTYPLILEHRISKLKEKISSEKFNEYQEIISIFKKLAKRIKLSKTRIITRNKSKELGKERLIELLNKSKVIREFIEENLNELNGKLGNPKSFNSLNKILDAQSYRLCHWKVAVEEINYRRFFDINELAAIRVEDKEVFENYHKLAFSLIEEGQVKGLRIDHPDGLYYPEKYFKDLQKSLAKPIYLIIEKILEKDEVLNPKWEVNGTVGYDFLNSLNDIFVQEKNKAAFNALYEDFLGYDMDFEELLYQKKKSFAFFNMAAEINALGNKLDSISELSRYYRDFTRNNLTLAIGEIIACFPVYRSYISPTDTSVNAKDQEYIKSSIQKAKSKASHLNPDIFTFLENVLLLKLKDILHKEEKLYRDFLLRFQQLTGPVMAKGLEDTSMYVYNKLISLNEVGGDPNSFGLSLKEFHKQNLARHRDWPYSMLTSSTHDTKRSEDLRARINVLSEIPEEWKEKVTLWTKLNKKHKSVINNVLEPRWNTEYFIYQTLIGVWSENSTEFQQRVWNYILKAIREAKLYTNWLNPNAEYEEAVQKFLMGILNDQEFLNSFLDFQEQISNFGKLNSISALVSKIGSPGVVDTYQGNEIWDYSLVDPDNRRTVDYEFRSELLEKIDKSLTQENLKLFILSSGLNFRTRNKKLFLDGEYIPLEVEGGRKNNIIAFLRKHNDQIAIILATRFFSELKSEISDILNCGIDWQGTQLILPKLLNNSLVKNIFTNESFKISNDSKLPVSEILKQLNVAILTNSQESSKP